MQRRKILFVFGTRPEAIKMAPLILLARKMDAFELAVCTTGQHREMLQQVMDFFGINADYQLDLMEANQTLFHITANALLKLEPVLEAARPDVVLVQGDTTTAFVGALAAYYKKIKVGHIEAGLRSYNKYAPFPEEINRKIAGVLTDFHFAPTEKAVQNLSVEGITRQVHQTGNTVIDALLWGVEKVRKDNSIASYYSFLDKQKRTILVTAHRRESFGAPLRQVCLALLEIVESFPDVQVVYPVHLNPNVQQVVQEMLGGKSNIYLTSPLDYSHLIWLMDQCTMVITDSGGIQEEAPSLGKPVLVIREVTERQEGVDAGTAILVGTEQQKIFTTASLLLNDKDAYDRMARAINPYGIGNAAKVILSILEKNLM